MLFSIEKNTDFREKPQSLKFLMALILTSVSTGVLANIDDNKLSTATTSDYSLLTLKANPQLFKEHLNQLIAEKNSTRIQTILPHYKELKNKDASIVKNANDLFDSVEEQNNKISTTSTDNKLATTTIKDNKGQQTTNSDLSLNPQQFTVYINALIAAGNVKQLKTALPKYKQLSNNDPFLIQYGEAIVYRAEGKNKQAIQRYKQMLAKDPSLNPVRVSLAMTLLEDRQYSTAKNQLLKLKGENLPKPIIQKVERSLEAINKSEELKYNLSIQPLYNNNLNDVPTNKMSSGLGKTGKPIKGYGIQASAGVSKKINLKNNFYTSLDTTINANVYVNENEYNDYNVSASNSWGYADKKNDLSISPFVKKRLLDNSAYYTQYGTKINGSRWLLPKLKLSANTQYIMTKYDDEKNSNRDSHAYAFGLSSFYTHNPTQYFYAGINHYNDEVEKSIILNYDRNSVYAGWGREWTKGLSTALSASYTKKDYADPTTDKSFAAEPYYSTFGGDYGDSRSDISKSLNGSIWKRDYTILGLTPKFVVNYSKTDSNFNYYDGRKTLNGTVVLNKTF